MKHKVSKHNSLENQVEYVINFMRTHEWASPLALPINLNENLDYFTERYLFDSYIDLYYAYQNYKQGNYVEAKRRLGYSLIWKDKATECSFFSGENDFTALLFNKTDEIFNNTIQEICSDEFSLDKTSNIELENIKNNLKKYVEPHSGIGLKVCGSPFDVAVSP
jgi:hypothetical protein